MIMEFKYANIFQCTDNVNEEVFMVSLIIGIGYLLCYVFMGSVINKVGPRTFSVGESIIALVNLTKK